MYMATVIVAVAAGLGAGPITRVAHIGGDATAVASTGATIDPECHRLQLDDNALDLVEGDLIGPPVIELCCAGGGVVGHLRRLFELAAILQIGPVTS